MAHRLTSTEKQERSRSDSIQDEARAEKQQAINEYHLLEFYKKHPDYNFTANDAFLLGYLEKYNLTIDAENLEMAFQAVAGQLAKKEIGYIQQVDLSQSRALPQQVNRQVSRPPVVLNFTREEIIAWPAEKFHQYIRRGPEVVAELNRILALNI